MMHAVQLESDPREHGVYLYSVTEQFDTTPATGRFKFRNIASAAEFERDIVNQRRRVGLHALAEEYRWPNDNPPLGYIITTDGKLEISEGDTELVDRIFQMYIEERSMLAVASRLNQEGKETTAGGQWTVCAVEDSLRNEIYCGCYELGEVSEHIPEYQIIDDERFDTVTDIRMRFQKRRLLDP